MIRICAYCGKVMGEKPPFEDRRVTHGMCDACLKEWKEKVKNDKGRTDPGVEAKGRR